MEHEDFLKLVTRYFNQQYDTEEEEIADEQIIISYQESIKPKTPTNDIVLDITNIKSNQLNNKLDNAYNIRIGNFLVKITKRKKDKIYPNVIIYETIKEGLITKVDILKDTRFKQTDWSIYFNSFKMGNNIPEEKVISIVRWLQGLNKLSAFI